MTEEIGDSAPAKTSSVALRSRGFRWLLSGQLVGLVGDQLFPIAMVGILSTRENMPFSLGVVFGARFLGLSLLLIATGVVADRLKKAQVLVSSDVVRALSVVGMIVLGLDAPMWALALLTFFMGAGEAVFQPAYDSFIPDLVEEKALASANTLTNMLRSVGQFAGPALGAVIVTHLGARTALTIDAVTFGVSTVAVLLAARHAAPVSTTAKRSEEGVERGSLIHDAREGFHVVVKLRWLGYLQLMALVNTLFAVGPWMVLLPFIVTERSQTLYGYGAILSCFAIGGLVGAPIAGALIERVKYPGVWAVVAISLFSLACFALAVQISWAAVLMLSAFAGAGTQFFDVVVRTAIHQQVPRAYLGRVFAIDFFASFAAMPAGQFLAGLLVSTAHGARVAMMASGLCVVATGAALLLSADVRNLSRSTDSLK